jgi:hypothetical protein
MTEETDVSFESLGEVKVHYSFNSPPLKNPTRHFLWYLAPFRPTSEFAGISVLEWQIPLLRKAMCHFTGKKYVVIAEPCEQDGPNTFVPVSEVASIFEELGISVLTMKHDPERREGPALVEMLGKCPQGPDDIIFFGQSKGVGRPVSFEAIRWWTKALIETTLLNAQEAQEALSTHSCAGSFKRYGAFRKPGNYCWHYSGSFYWLRASEVFKRNWRHLHSFFASVEAWPGYQFKRKEAACLFMDNAGHLYDKRYWEEVVFEHLSRWRAGQAVSACGLED